ncbi:MAG TPA: M28 family peptidase [Flavobacteriales bacterium]|nr:M28 family peptidase [Flavobacteriales bacterium]
MRIGIFILFIFCLEVNAQSILQKGRKHVNTLAADNMFGRGYVHNGYHEAAIYLCKEFKKLGLSAGDGYLQEFTYPVNTFPDSVAVYLDNMKLKTGADFIVHEASGSDSGIFIPHYFSVNDLFLKLEPVFQPNEIVVVDPLPAKMHGDSVAIIQKRLERFNQQVPIIQLVNDKLIWGVALQAFPHATIQLKSEKFDKTVNRVKLNIRNKINPAFHSYNVIAVKKAKRKKYKDYLVITAHLDHLGMMGSGAIFNGANDNASGVAMLLVLAEYYAHRELKTNIAFIAFGGEEAGLIGSKFFVDNPRIPLDKIKFLLNLDLMGTGEEGITVVNATKFVHEFELLKKINADNNYVKQVKPRGEAANSDHYWFTKRGVPSFFMYALGGTTAYHDIYDRPEQLSLTEFEDLYKMIIAFFEQIQLTKK